MGDTTVIICIDGLDPEYLEACEAPALRDLARRGFQETVRCMMPSVTNVNNVSMVTGAYPESHGICSNYWLDKELGEGAYLESGEHVLAETLFQRAHRQGRSSLLATSKDKLRTLLGTGASLALSSERPAEWAVKLLGPPPPIYSLEVNAWTVRAATAAMSRDHVDVAYISTTDFAMHTYGPEHPESQRHISLLDDVIGDLITTHPDVGILITADHGMSSKTRMADLQTALEDRNISGQALPIIKDRYVQHHANLGGSCYVYVDRSADLGDALDLLREVLGVQEALPREEAAAKFHLRGEMIGDIVVTGEKDVVFGNPAEVAIPPGLRSHGSTHELSIPLIGCNLDVGDLAFLENRDVGRYVIERVLPEAE